MPSRVCIVGAQGVGKSSIVARIDDTSFSSQTSDTGILFANCDIVLGEENVTLEILDISGEEKLRCMGPIYHREAKGALCVFDLTSERSFQALDLWVDSVRNNASEECLIVIVGNKADLWNLRQISKERGEKYAKSKGAKYFEVSAVSGSGLLNIFIYLAKHIVLWRDCTSSYAAKRTLISNCAEYVSPLRDKKRRFSFPLRKMSFIEQLNHD